MTEYGIFSDEGCIETGFYSVEEAQAALTKRYATEDGLAVSEICPDHEDHARDTCEDCNSEDEDTL